MWLITFYINQFKIFEFGWVFFYGSELLFVLIILFFVKSFINLYIHYLEDGKIILKSWDSLNYLDSDNKIHAN